MSDLNSLTREQLLDIAEHEYFMDRCEFDGESDLFIIECIQIAMKDLGENV